MTIADRWTPERDALLRQLWAEGVTATKLADELNRTVVRGREELFTKNSVIGRVHRQGLAEHGHKTAPSTPGEVRVVKPRRPRPSRAKKPVDKPLPPPISMRTPAVIVRPRQGKPATLMQLRPDECRWPVEEDPAILGRYRFCAKPVEHGGATYCPEHAERHYQHHGVGYR